MTHKYHTRNKDEALRIDKLTVAVDGNVGIGIVNPTHKLDVNGNINIPNANTIKFGGDVLIKRWETNKAIAIGKLAGTDKLRCYYFGDEAGVLNTQENLVAIGYQAAYNNSGNSIVAIGYRATHSNSGTAAIGIGSSATHSNSGTAAIGIGSSAAGSNSGNYAIGIGQAAVYDNSGVDVVGIGYYAGRENTGDNVVAIGNNAGFQNTGNNFLAIGFGAGYKNIGNNLVAIGYYAGFQNTGNNCIFLGYESGKSNVTANQFIVKQANINAIPLIQGDFSTGHIDFAGEIKIKVYSQDAEPTLSADQRMAMWIDTDDSNRVYLLFRRAVGDQTAVELS